jgi:hypothetical protein
MFLEFAGSLAGLVIGVILLLLPCWKLCTRTGFSGWFSLIIFIPLGFVFLLYVLAFSEWPNQADGPKSKDEWLAKINDR